MKKKFALATLAVSAASNLGNMAYGNCKAILQASAMFVLLSVGIMLVSCRQDVSRRSRSRRKPCAMVGLTL